MHFMTTPASTSWLTDQRFALPSDVAPNQTVTLDVSVTAPPGDAGVLQATMVKEQQLWFKQWANVPVGLQSATWMGSYDARAIPRTWTFQQTQTFPVTKDEIVIGRQAPDVWADLSLDTSLDVSREHARLQRTADGRFRIKDLSKLGTTVNGTPLPRSLENGDGGVRDLDRWVDLPDKARIGLAGVIYLDFERTAGA